MVLKEDLRLFHLTPNSVIQANSAYPDKTPRSVTSDLHCLPMSQSRLYR